MEPEPYFIQQFHTELYLLENPVELEKMITTALGDLYILMKSTDLVIVSNIAIVAQYPKNQPLAVPGLTT
jgi:hypothetical protein